MHLSIPCYLAAISVAFAGVRSLYHYDISASAEPGGELGSTSSILFSLEPFANDEDREEGASIDASSKGRRESSKLDGYDGFDIHGQIRRRGDPQSVKDWPLGPKHRVLEWVMQEQRKKQGRPSQKQLQALKAIREAEDDEFKTMKGWGKPGKVWPDRASRQRAEEAAFSDFRIKLTRTETHFQDIRLATEQHEKDAGGIIETLGMTNKAMRKSMLKTFEAIPGPQRPRHKTAAQPIRSHPPGRPGGPHIKNMPDRDKHRVLQLVMKQQGRKQSELERKARASFIISQQKVAAGNEVMAKAEDVHRYREGRVQWRGGYESAEGAAKRLQALNGKSQQMQKDFRNLAMVNSHMLYNLKPNFKFPSAVGRAGTDALGSSPPSPGQADLPLGYRLPKRPSDQRVQETRSDVAKKEGSDSPRAQGSRLPQSDTSSKSSDPAKRASRNFLGAVSKTIQKARGGFPKGMELKTADDQKTANVQKSTGATFNKLVGGIRKAAGGLQKTLTSQQKGGSSKADEGPKTGDSPMRRGRSTMESNPKTGRK